MHGGLSIIQAGSDEGKSQRDGSSIPIGVRLPVSLMQGRVQVLEERGKNRRTYFEAHEVSQEFLRKLKCSLLLERPVIPLNFCSGSLSLKKDTKFLLLLGELFRFLLM
jgi:hypothetical protein